MNTPSASFIETLRLEGSPLICPRKLASALGITLSDLAELLRVHRNTLRKPASPSLRSAVSQLLCLLSAAIELRGDVEDALFWFRNQPIPDLGHFTGLQLVRHGRHIAVHAYIDGINSGSSG